MSFGTRINAWLAHEVSAGDARALSAAGDIAYDLVTGVTDLYRQMLLDGRDPWTAQENLQTGLLASWVAVALMTLGDSFLDAGEQAGEHTRGFVPEVTLRQVMAFYEPVETWLTHARQAQANPGHRLSPWSLPAELPPWQEVEPCPREHLEAMLMAVAGTARRLGLQARAEAAMADFEEHAPPGRAAQRDQVRELMAAAATAAAMAQALHGQRGRHVSEELHERIEDSVKRSIEDYFTAGQLMAMPSLIPAPDAPAPGRGPAGRPAQAAPPAGFDPWRLTDPAAREAWRDSPRERDAIDTLWAFDPDRERTAGIQGEIDAALARGDVGYATDGGAAVPDPLDPRRKGHFKDCPWSAIYVAVRDCVIAGRRLGAGEEFTFEVSARDVPAGGRFRRAILTGTFAAHHELGYGQPASG